MVWFTKRKVFWHWFFLLLIYSQPQWIMSRRGRKNGKWIVKGSVVVVVGFSFSHFSCQMSCLLHFHTLIYMQPLICFLINLKQTQKLLTKSKNLEQWELYLIFPLVHLLHLNPSLASLSFNVHNIKKRKQLIGHFYTHSLSLTLSLIRHPFDFSTSYTQILIIPNSTRRLKDKKVPNSSIWLWPTSLDSNSRPIM